jgi:heat shock protein 1/8
MDVLNSYFKSDEKNDKKNDKKNNDNINSELENNDNINNELENNDNINNELENNKQSKNIILNETIIGIDLGTTNSCVSVWRNNNLEIIPDENGNRTIPSVVAFTNRSTYIGYEAYNQKDINSKNVFYEVKRLIGRNITDETVINDKEYLLYDICECENNKENIVIKSNLLNKKTYTPEEISAMILIKLKTMASNYLNEEITKAVITVPAYFNDSQRQATCDAAKIAGLECIRIINEPTSAALAYGIERISKNKLKNKDNINNEIHILVYDFGGGTLDVSLLSIYNGVFEVLGSCGNTHLGGADFDNRLVSYCMSEFKKKNKIKTLDNLSGVSLQKLRRSCENAKKILSSNLKTIISVSDFYDNKNLIVKITRNAFNKLCNDLLILCLKPLDDILHSCDINKELIDEVILVGGSTRIFAIHENIKLFFSKEPNNNINPDEVVAAGAAIQGYIISHKKDPFSESVILLDIVQLSLGIETMNGINDVIIPRNSIIPITKKQKYTTCSDNETSVLVKVHEGERSLTKDNFKVGEFELCNIESKLRGYAKIEVTFSIDINGIINVTAEDMRNTENKKNIRVSSNKGRLTKLQIDKLIENAKEMEMQDKINNKKKRLYFEIDDLINNINENLNNDELQLIDSDKEKIHDDINKIKLWHTENNSLDIEIDKYIEILDKLKKKYGSLILKMTYSCENVKSQQTTNNSASIYGNGYGENEIDEENNNYYNTKQHENDEMLENEIDIDDTINADEKSEIKKSRSELIELCYELFEIINSEHLRMSNDHKIELKNYIDDTLLWIHIQNKLVKKDIILKINEINETCNDIFDIYKNDNKEIFNDFMTDSIKDELFQLCNTLKSSIISNIYSCNEIHMKNLNDKITESLNLVKMIDQSENDADFYKNEIEEKINDVNNLCNVIYKSIMSIDI